MENIYKEFDKIINEETQDYDLREFLSNQCTYGQDVIIYYEETTSLYNKYKKDCETWLENSVNETGLNPWELFPNWDVAIDSVYNKWNIVVAMFESYCDYLLEGLDQDKK